MNQIQIAEKRKRIIDFASIITIITAFLLIYIFPLFGIANAFDTKSQVYNMVDIIMNGVSSSVSAILTGDGTYADFYDFMVSSSGGFADAVSDAYTVFKSIGIGLVFVYGMVHAIQNAQKEQDTNDVTYKLLIELAVCCIFIINLDDIVAWVMDLGGFIAELVSFTASNPDNVQEVVDTLVPDNSDGLSSFLVNMPLIIGLFPPYLIAYLCTIAGKFVAFQILIEIGIRRMFTPIAIVDIYAEGMRSSGARWLKKFLACFIKIAACIAVCYIGGQLQSIVMTNTFADEAAITAYFFEMVAIQFSVVGMLFKISEVANDVVGV